MSAPRPMKPVNWCAAIQHCQQVGRGYVIATVINTQGSTPRDGGSKMVIDADACYDTLGGGQLEFLVIQQARELLAKNESCQVFKPFPLAAEAAQCCGGSVTVMLECFASSRWQIALFGGGHVSQALISILGGLPCQVRVLDNREELANGFDSSQLPANCRLEPYTSPEQAVATLQDNSWVVVFTHDHALDYRLCEALLNNYRWAYVGLIGSATKAERFRKRLAAAGIVEQVLAKLWSPIGLPEVRGKLPMEVAVSIAAQMQSLYYQAHTAAPDISTSWRDIKRIIREAQPLQPQFAAHNTATQTTPLNSETQS